MEQISERRLKRLQNLLTVKINNVQLSDQEIIFLCSILKREYSDLYMKMQNTYSELSFSRRQARDEMIICLKLLTLVERSNRKWILELNLSQEKAKMDMNINA